MNTNASSVSISYEHVLRRSDSTAARRARARYTRTCDLSSFYTTAAPCRNTEQQKKAKGLEWFVLGLEWLMLATPTGFEPVSPA